MTVTPEPSAPPAAVTSLPLRLLQLTSKNLKWIGSLFSTLLISIILLGVLIHLGDSLAWLSTALGLTAGWAAGLLLAPYESEQERFREYAKLVSVFISGYLVSKVDRLIELWFDPEHGPILLRPLVVHRILLCITSFLLAAVWTYVARKYFSWGPGSEQPPKKTEAAKLQTP
jgi:hypothetical protein